MPKKSTKSRSKRVKLKDKFKVIRKVKEHNRKQRREVKKAGKRKPSVLKDPGIPAQLPYREKLVKEMQFERDRILATEAAKREARKARRLARKEGNEADLGDDEDSTEAGVRQLSETNKDEEMLNEEEDGDVAALAQFAQHALSEEERFAERSISSLLPGPSQGPSAAPIFYKQLRGVLAAADVILHVLDARDPLACRATAIERTARSLDPNKSIVLVLNKADLVPGEVTQQWLSYFRQELPCVAFKCSTKKTGAIGRGRGSAAGSRRRGTGAKAEASGGAGPGTSDCLGAQALLALLRGFARRSAGGSGVAVGVVGVPNVGKSSLINSLKRARATATGDVPGVTRAVQEVAIDKRIRLLDSPGVIFPSAESEVAATLRCTIKVEVLEDPCAAVGAVLGLVPARQLMCLYNIGTYDSPEGFLSAVARVRGKLRHGGTADVAAAARLVLHDWNSGRIPFFTRPPRRGDDVHESAAVVAAWAPEWDANGPAAADEAALVGSEPQAGTLGCFEVPSVGPIQMPDLEVERECGALGRTHNLQKADKEVCDGVAQRLPRGSGVAKATTQTLSHVDRRRSQNAVFYGAAGQHNPKLAKAAKRKARSSSNLEIEPPSSMDQDFDFSMLGAS